jgi:hypothetical protein
MTVRLQRVGLLSLAAVAAVNLWTGGPLLSIWLGSRVQGGSTQLRMESVLVIIVALIAISMALLKVLAVSRAKYDELSGVVARQRRTPWLRSMRGERDEDLHSATPTSAVDKIVMIVVVLAIIAFEIWFFFFSGSSLPNP